MTAKSRIDGVTQVALTTQVNSIACKPDAKQLWVTRIARGKHAADVLLDATTLAVLTDTATPPDEAGWLPVATLDKGLITRSRQWTVGVNASGLFIKDLQSQALKAPAPFNDPTLTVTAFAISADERWAVIGNTSGYVVVYEVATGDRRWGARIHRGHVTAACICPDGQRAFTGSATGELCAIELPD